MLAAGYQTGTYLLQQKSFNPKLIIFFGGVISVTGFFLASLTESFWMFIVLYGVLGGIGMGTIYMIPLVCAYKYFPNKKGLVTGIIVGSYGLGSSIFNILATLIVNPNNLSPTIPAPNGDKELKFFLPEVAERVPMMFHILCAIWLCLILSSASLISLPK